MINSSKSKEIFGDVRFGAISVENERTELDHAESHHSLLIRAVKKNGARVAEDTETLTILLLIMIGCVNVSEVRTAVGAM